jgi:3-methyladenine DNA glycosylase Tag
MASTKSNIPEQLEPRRLGDYLEVMTQAVFQAGLSWASIASRWDKFREAFEGFDAERVAAYTEGDIDRLMHFEGILHSSRKIRATIQNAQTLVALDLDHKGFANYLRAFPSYEALAKDIKRRFKFMGEMNVWYFLFLVRQPVPRFEHWVTTIPGDHPRMKEMVEKGRSAGTSTEF